jgi:hypothetical protein
MRWYVPLIPLYAFYGVDWDKFYCFGKAVPIYVWKGPEGCWKLRLQEFLDCRHTKVARLSAVCTGHIYTPRRYPWP